MTNPTDADVARVSDKLTELIRTIARQEIARAATAAPPCRCHTDRATPEWREPRNR